jgi:hypothetical protein
MKRSAFAISLVLFASTWLVQGQVPASFGLKAGLSMANQSWKLTNIDYTLDTEPITGLAAAFFVEAFKGKHFSFQVEVAYLEKGSKTTTESVSVNHAQGDRIEVNQGTESTSLFTYISVSTLGRYRFDLEHLVPYFLLGPRLDFLLKYGSESDHPLETQNGTLFGLNLGTGLEYRFNQSHFFAEIQFQPDLSPVTNTEPLLINNNMLFFSIGFRRIVSF